MNSDDFESLSGQLAAVSSTLAALISALPSPTASDVLQHLEATNESDRENDQPGSEAFAKERDGSVAAYAALLRSVLSSAR